MPLTCGMLHRLCSTTSGSLVVRGTPYLSKLESIASSAVRAADKVRVWVCVCFVPLFAQANCHPRRWCS